MIWAWRLLSLPENFLKSLPAPGDFWIHPWTDWNYLPFSCYFVRGERKMWHMAKSGLYGGCSITVTPFYYASIRSLSLGSLFQYGFLILEGPSLSLLRTTMHAQHYSRRKWRVEGRNKWRVYPYQTNWNQALTGALQSPSIDKWWKGTHGVLNSRVYSYLFSKELV